MRTGRSLAPASSPDTRHLPPDPRDRCPGRVPPARWGDGCPGELGTLANPSPAPGRRRVRSGTDMRTHTAADDRGGEGGSNVPRDEGDGRAGDGPDAGP